MLIASIIGQKDPIASLEKSLEKGQLPHFQVFIDEGGYGGLALGLYLAGRLLQVETLEKLKQHPDMHFVFPSLKSDSEKQKRQQEAQQEWLQFCEQPYASYADWMEQLDGGNKEGIIGKEAVVALQEKIQLKAFLGKEKVVLLWGAEKINETAANKLLKSLEEPPEHTYFIFITADANKLLPTIQSRAQSLHLQRVADSTIYEALKKRGCADAQSKQIAVTAQGSWQMALNNLTSTDTALAHEDLWVTGLRVAFRARQNKAIVQELMDWAESLAQQSRPQQLSFLDYGMELMRQAMLINFGAKEISFFHSQTGFNIEKLAPFIHSLNVPAIKALLEEKRYYIARNANAKIQYTDLAFQLTRLLHLQES